MKHRDTESTERKTRGRRIRGGSEKQEEEDGGKSKKKRREGKARRRERSGKQEEGRVKKGDMLAMLDAGLYF